MAKITAGRDKPADADMGLSGVEAGRADLSGEEIVSLVPGMYTDEESTGTKGMTTDGTSICITARSSDGRKGIINPIIIISHA